MAYNYLEDGLSEGLNAVRTTARRAGEAVSNTAEAVGRSFSDNAPNYRPIAPSTGDGTSKFMDTARSALSRTTDFARGIKDAAGYTQLPSMDTVFNKGFNLLTPTYRGGPATGFGSQTPASQPRADAGGQPQNSILGVSGSRKGRLLTLEGRDSATGRGPNSGFVEYAPGDAAYSLEQGRQANAIRQQTIDAQPRGVGIVIPEYNNDYIQRPGGSGSSADLYRQANKLIQDPMNRNDSTTQFQNLRSARLLQDQAGEMENTQRAGIVAGSALQRTQMENEAAAPYRAASAQEARARAVSLLQPDSPELVTPDDMAMLIDSGLLLTDEDGAVVWDSPFAQKLRNKIASQYSQTRSYADGGLVAPPDQMYADGGRVSALGRTTPQQPNYPELADYQRYAAGSQAMGLAPVGFEQFMSMRQGAVASRGGAAGKGVIGFSEGGQVPDTSVAGKMVIDTDPATSGDTIPAMIDGTQPAALKSNEFVIPADVVMFFGTDKLNKMIAQARKIDDGGSIPAAGSVSANLPTA